MIITELFSKIQRYMDPVDYLPYAKVNDTIRRSLVEDIVFAAGKIGSGELFAMRTVEFGYRKREDEAFKLLTSNAGFYPSEDRACRYKYVEVMRATLKEIDFFVKMNGYKDYYFIKKYGRQNASYTGWYSNSFEQGSWALGLDGKKVLVISPFEKSIKKQFERLDLVHSYCNKIPQFDLDTIKAVQSIGGHHPKEFPSWFDSLKYMEGEADKREFDVALIGCGAYGLPLCAHIKKTGRSAFHLGGDCQLLFGIMGKRWENNEGVNRIRNEYWIYPDESEVPEGAEKVEGGCYWG